MKLRVVFLLSFLMALGTITVVVLTSSCDSKLYEPCRIASSMVLAPLTLFLGIGIYISCMCCKDIDRAMTMS
jgi:hypothetical protein